MLLPAEEVTIYSFAAIRDAIVADISVAMPDLAMFYAIIRRTPCHTRYAEERY